MCSFQTCIVLADAIELDRLELRCIHFLGLCWYKILLVQSRGVVNLFHNEDKHVRERQPVIEEKYGSFVQSVFHWLKMMWYSFLGMTWPQRNNLSNPCKQTNNSLILPPSRITCLDLDTDVSRHVLVLETSVSTQI